MKTIRFSILLLVISSLPAIVFGQTAATARISGVVTDAQGAVVSGATVKLIDKTTRLEKDDTTNSEGRYVFASIEPGLYEIKAIAQGFRTTIVTEVLVEVSKVTTVDLALQAGGVTEEVTVKAAGDVQLQTDDAAVGSVIEAGRITRLPSLDRRVTGLIMLQPTVAPNGEVSGARRDQNTFTLDGLDVSDQVGFRGATGTVVPIPGETVEQLRLTVANPNATFGRSGGGQMALVSKRGGNAFRGSVYEYHQNDNLNANSWVNNRNKLNKPPLIDNRFGFSLGGPIWKEKLFFFGNYEGRRLPGNTQVARLVPTQTLRDGKLLFRDAAGAVFTTDPLEKDPRNFGSNPQILAYLKTLPLPNSAGGDGLNTGVFLTNLATTTNEDFGALRFDYQINQKWSVDARGSLYRSIQNSAGQFDIVNLKPTDSISSRPKNLTFAVTGTPRSNLVNEVRIGHAYDNAIRDRLAPTTIAGFNVPVNLAGIDEAIDLDVNRANDQTLGGATTQFIDNATWSKGAHTFQFGGSMRRISTFHYRDDRLSALSAPVADIGGAGSVVIPAAQRPPACGGGVTQNCLQSADRSRYDQLYGALLGLVNNVSYMAVRDIDLQPLPIGTGLINDVVLRHWEFYFSDVWKMKSSFTLAFGLQYQWHTPPVDVLGRQTALVYKDSKELIDPLDYLSRKKAAAEAGEIFNPDIAYTTLKDAGREGGFDINRQSFGPRISVAWQPSFDEGLRGRLFGNRKTVLRGGYSLLYDRLNTVSSVIVPMLGVGFAQTPSLVPTTVGGQPWRAGIDGPIPLPPNLAVTPPIAPAKAVGVTTAFGEATSVTIDPRIGDPYSHMLNFTIQRELSGNMVIEIGYVGRFARNAFQSVNLNSAPYFFKDKASGQTFAEAFDKVAAELRSGTPANAVKPQNWFENQLKETPQANTTGVTRALASLAGPSFINGDVSNVWNIFLDGIAPIPYNNRQVIDLHIRTSLGRSNYNALFVSLNKRLSHGLVFGFNYTLSRSFDQIGQILNDGQQFSTSFDPNVDYGLSDFDRTHNVNANFVYDLPFGVGRRFDAGKGLDRVIGGWYVSGIFQALSGAPLTVSQGGRAYGGGATGFTPTSGALPVEKPDVGNSVHSGVVGSGGIGTTGNPANATPGSGLNLFANPEEVFKGFRRINLASDGRQGRGVLRGLPFWGLDLSFGKQTKITESVKFALSFDFFNALNRVNFNTPGLSLTSPATFGVITGASAPRRIQVGARVEF